MTATTRRILLVLLLAVVLMPIPTTTYEPQMKIIPARRQTKQGE